MWVLLVGNIKQGFEVYGPFETAEEAQKYGDSHNYEYQLAQLLFPVTNAG